MDTVEVVYSQTDYALLALRLVVGFLLMGHGTQKLFGWFGGRGLEGTAGWIGALGFRPPVAWAVIAGDCEAAGGMLLALGLFNPVGGLLIGASMLTAIAKVHWPKVWASENGLEHPLLVLAVCAAIGVAGPGALSLDHVFGTALPTTATLVALVATLVGWATAMAFTMRHPVTGHAGAHAH